MAIAVIRTQSTLMRRTVSVVESSLFNYDTRWESMKSNNQDKWQPGPAGNTGGI